MNILRCEFIGEAVRIKNILLFFLLLMPTIIFGFIGLVASILYTRAKNPVTKVLKELNYQKEKYKNLFFSLLLKNQPYML